MFSRHYVDKIIYNGNTQPYDKKPMRLNATMF